MLLLHGRCRELGVELEFEREITSLDDIAELLAEHGAKVVVNDLVGARDVVGSDLGPADEVVAEIK